MSGDKAHKKSRLLPRQLDQENGPETLAVAKSLAADETAERRNASSLEEASSKQAIHVVADRLVAHIRNCSGATTKCLVAFSGGVDSVVVAQAAFLALGERATAVTAVSPSLAGGELESARSLAIQIGISHEVIRTQEFANPEYLRNAPDRCYHCKTELYEQLEGLCEKYPDSVILNGANLDDQGDYRPGLRAAREHQVRSPLLECGIDKATVRRLAESWQLPVWDKPAMPCLSSRIAYGEEVTPERLRMVDLAEQFLRSHGFKQLRVRYHKGDLARVEVESVEVTRLVAQPFRGLLTDELKRLGFKFVTIDMDGFRSGNLNTLIPVESLQQSVADEDASS